jgi:HSP20 family protein
MGAQPWLGPGWDPFGDLAEIQQELNRLFDTFFGQRPGRPQTEEGAWAPPMDVCETRDHLRVLIELPGVPQDQIQVEILEGVLTIRGERRPDPAFRNDQLQRMERRYGAFCRRLDLPPVVDPEGIRATYRDGVLEIRLPKLAGAAPRAIAVEVP